MIIAVDGPAAAGKGTLAKRLAAHFGFAYLDTGSLYRAVASKLLRGGGHPEDAAAAAQAAGALTADDLAATDLRTPDVAQASSKVSAHPDVRAALLDYQRNFGRNPPDGQAGAVLDGRDVGTHVFPDADVKLYVTASDEARAQRRFLELQAAGLAPVASDVLRDLQERDKRDRERAAAPMRPAKDALLLDTSNLGIEAAFEAALALVGKAGAKPE